MTWHPLFVRVGQAITEKLWNGLVSFVASVRLIEGPGIRLIPTPEGTIISAKGGANGSTFLHPFRVTLGGDRATIRPGLVNGVEPAIASTPLSGDKKNPAPFLDLSKPKLAADGRGYIALEIECGPAWEITKGKVQVVQVASWETDSGEPPIDGTGGPAAIGGVPGLKKRRVRYPLALLRPNLSGQLEAFQIVHFNLIHRAKPRDEKSDIARHFFWMGGAA